MKILAVAHSTDFSGGANRSFFQVVMLLREKHHVDVEVLLPNGEGEMKKRCLEAHIPVYQMRFHSCCSVFRKEPKDIFRMAKLRIYPIVDFLCLLPQIGFFQNQRYDLIYTNDRLVTIGAELARLLHLPHIWHIRSFGALNGNTYSRRLEILMDRYTEKLIAISRAVAEECERQYNPEKIQLIYNGVPFPKQVDHQHHQGYRLLLTGRLVEDKGQILALQALKRLNRNRREKITLTLAGSVPSYDDGKYARRLHNFVRENEMKEEVFFAGEVKNMEMLRNQMDAELICSSNEPFGRVTVEAMRQQLLVIGSASGATKELIDDGQTGLLFKAGSPEELALKIGFAADHPEESHRMAMAGYFYSLERFTAEKNAAEIYDTMLNTVRRTKACHEE